jgi:hypothetical protein
MATTFFLGPTAKLGSESHRYGMITIYPCIQSECFEASLIHGGQHRKGVHHL